MVHTLNNTGLKIAPWCTLYWYIDFSCDVDPNSKKTINNPKEPDNTQYATILSLYYMKIQGKEYQINSS